MWRETSNSKKKEFASKQEARKGSQTAANQRFLTEPVRTPRQPVCVFILQPRV